MQACREYVILEPEPEPETAGGIAIPEIAQRGHHGDAWGVPRIGVGRVVSLGGPELVIDDNEIIGQVVADVQVGARVVYERTSARDLGTHDGRDLVIVRHWAVWAELDEGVRFDPPRGNEEV